MTTPEIVEKVGSEPSLPEGVKEIPEKVEIPEDVERVTGVRAKPANITAQVADDSTKTQVPSSTPPSVTVSVPATPAQLTNWLQGSPSNSITWFATFWLRLIRKALHFGWKVILKKEVEA